MVARDGIEPPTPAFSGCDYLIFSTTYSGTSDSVSICKYVEDRPMLVESPIESGSRPLNDPSNDGYGR